VTVTDKRPESKTTRLITHTGRHRPGTGPTPTTLGPYRITGHIGSGGMADVLLVEDVELGRELAAKILPQASHDDPKTVQRFLLEAQVTGQLEHPNIVPVHQMGVTPNGQLYFTMKRVRGLTLEETISSGVTRETLSRLLEIFLKVCDAMAFAHSRGVIHRDLKPENIMVGEFGEVQVMDWGLARLRDEQDQLEGAIALDLDSGKTAAAVLGREGEERKGSNPLKTQDGTIAGTPAYMPPEQALGQVDALDERSDIYALGAMLYQILTGDAPFGGEDSWAVLGQVIRAEMKLPRERAPGRNIPRELEAVVLKAMQRDPEDRYQTVRELRLDLQRFIEGHTLSAARYTIAQRLAKWIARHRTIAIASGVVLLVACAFSGLTLVNVWERRKAQENARQQRAATLLQQAKRQLAEKLQVEAEKQQQAAQRELLRQLRKRTALALRAALILRRAGLVAPLAQFGLEVKSACEEAMGKLPRLAEPHVHLGRIYRVLMSDSRALAQQEAALRKDPNHPQALYERVVLLVRQHHKLVDRLSADVMRSEGARLAQLGGGHVQPGARVVRPSYAELLRRFSSLRNLRRVLTQDLKRLTGLIERGAPGIRPGEVVCARGLLAWAERRTKDARRLLKLAVKRDPTLEVAYEVLAVMARLANRFADAIRWFDRGLAVDKGYLPHLEGRAQALFRWAGTSC